MYSHSPGCLTSDAKEIQFALSGGRQLLSQDPYQSKTNASMNKVSTFEFLNFPGVVEFTDV